MSASFWLDSQCFEAFAMGLTMMFKKQDLGLSKSKIAQIINEMCHKIKLMVSTCRTADYDEENQSQSSDQLNHRAYKTIVLFQTSALPHFFEIMLQIFHGSATGSLDQIHAIKIMTDCLRHYSMKIMTGKNQMAYKTHSTNNLYV